MIQRAINKAFSMAKARGWDRLYVAVDIHDTMIIPNYDEHNIPKTFFPDALKAMQYLSSRPDVVLIMYTCSQPIENLEYTEFFLNNGINFQYINENPEVKSSGYGYYERKFYFNIMIEDKAGFDPIVDWKAVLETFQQQPVLWQPEKQK